MALTATLTTETIVKITLAGDLDASTAQSFKEVVEKAAAAKPKRLILMMQKLDFMASAGLRILMFAKQKMGADTDIYMVGTQEMVKGTIKKTGFDQAVIMLDKYDG